MALSHDRDNSIRELVVKGCEDTRRVLRFLKVVFAGCYLLAHGSFALDQAHST